MFRFPIASSTVICIACCVLCSGCGGPRAGGGGGVAGDSSPETGARVYHSEIEQLLAEADQLIAQSKYEAARDVYARALEIEPYDPRAQHGYDLASSYLNEGSLLSETMIDLRLRREAALAEFDAAVARAEASRRDARFANARGQVLAGLGTIEAERDYLTVQEYMARRLRAEELLEKIESTRELHDLAYDGR